MKHIKRFNEEVDQSDDNNDIFPDDLDRLTWFVRDNEDEVLELIEFWETSNGREFNQDKYDHWFDNNMLYEIEVDD